MNTAHEFMSTYRLYKRSHSVVYAVKAAWRIAVQRLPF